MGTHGNLWELMGTYGNLWELLAWELMELTGACGNLWELMGIFVRVFALQGVFYACVIFDAIIRSEKTQRILSESTLIRLSPLR